MERAGASGSGKSIFVCCRATAQDAPRSKIAQALDGMGRSALVFSGLWYLETALSASDVKAKLSSLLEPDDSLAVIDATNHEAAWRNIRPDAAELIRQCWENGAVPTPRASTTARAPARDKPGIR